MVNPKYPGRRGDRNYNPRSPGFKTGRLDQAMNKAPYRGGGGKKPPSKLCVQIAPWAAWPALISLAVVIGKTLA